MSKYVALLSCVLMFACSSQSTEDSIKASGVMDVCVEALSQGSLVNQYDAEATAEASDTLYVWLKDDGSEAPDFPAIRTHSADTTVTGEYRILKGGCEEVE